MTSKKETPDNDKQPIAKEPNPHAKVADFATSIQDLASYAQVQAQADSEYQSRWQWWSNHLNAFLREVKQHVKN